MEQNSQIKILEAQIRECFGRLVWTHTTHQKCIDLLEKKEKRIKKSQIVLNTISATGLISYIINNQSWIPPLSALLTTIALALDIYCLSYDIGKEKELHINLVNKLWNIREKYFSLLTDIKIGKLNEDEIIIKRDKLQEELNEAYQNGPRTNSKAYRIASKALKQNEENQCVLKDDMNKIYDAISKCDNIIIMSPIYMNQITGILKNVFDRFNPYCASEKLKGKKC